MKLTRANIIDSNYKYLPHHQSLKLVRDQPRVPFLWLFQGGHKDPRSVRSQISIDISRVFETGNGHDTIEKTLDSRGLILPI